ncbi:oxidoreductase [Oleiphilus messinensis]|uniref:Oxidoreductase n=1 Tax=Oleiphilus messinensis TaxID=141451 RepID=A0A1Y0I7Z5_9GAMM|nr:NAD(P)/FAD-dependent oxidoreductase [Oleiphilus messinensis]ARU55615.1 oxidoreductase [Oleiphilus messinensis]
MENNKTNSPTIYDVLIVGAGISGIGAGIRLLESRFSNFVILEKAGDLGGTWRDNTYPGCECDIPSALYSFSFAQKPDWSRVFAGQSEILDYIRSTATEFGIEDYIRYHHPVKSAQWNEADHLWYVKTDQQEFRARAVIACGGYLHEPIIPNIPGLEQFSGHWFHSSRWDHAYDLTGKRVAVVGTGASAIQFIPEIQPQVESLTVFQRTPQWILPKPNYTVSSVEKKLFKQKSILNSWRKSIFGSLESFGIGFRHPKLLKQFEKIGRLHLRMSVKDSELRDKLTPDYTLGCKRTLLSNDYYPAVSQPNVTLHATGLKSVSGNTLIGQDGSEAEVDVLILGTGFYVTEPPIAEKIRDDQGRTLAEHWHTHMQAYRGTTINGFPNAFMVLGPNLGIGHNSAFIVIEAQLNYIMDALITMRAQNLSRIEVKPDVQEAYNVRVQKALQGTVWNTGGCSSYYLDKSGFNSVGFPWSTLKMQSLLSQFDPENYATAHNS